MLTLLLLAALVGAGIVVARGWSLVSASAPPWGRWVLGALAVPLALGLAVLAFFVALSVLWSLFLLVGGYIMIA